MPPLSLTQTTERQLELFNQNNLCNLSANIKKVGKDNITRKFLEARL